MRNLEECRAEVFRRSEARIRARKRRKIAILTACVPLVLCVALVWAAGLPGKTGERASGLTEEYAPESAMGAVPAGTRPAMGAVDDAHGQVFGAAAGKTETDFPGVEVRVTGFDPENGGTLTVVWENKTQYEVMYGAEYTVMRRGEDQWVSCQRRGDLAFEAIGYLLMPGQTKTEVYSLAYTYDASAPGVYRFESSCFVQNTPNESAKCTLSAEFTVE